MLTFLPYLFPSVQLGTKFGLELLVSSAKAAVQSHAAVRDLATRLIAKTGNTASDDSDGLVKTLKSVQTT